MVGRPDLFCRGRACPARGARYHGRRFSPRAFGSITPAYLTLQGPPNKKASAVSGGFWIKPGDFLLSHALARAVPSGLRGLTAVFGMGTGGSLSLRSPRSRRRQEPEDRSE